MLLLDYRGYVGNPGSPSEDGLLADARAARAYLLSRADVDPARLVYFGESLGAAVAVALAAEHPPAALILRSPFTSLADIAAVHYPFLPAGLMLRDRYESIERIGRVRAPLLVVAGQRDRIVPFGAKPPSVRGGVRSQALPPGRQRRSQRRGPAGRGGHGQRDDRLRGSGG